MTPDVCVSRISIAIATDAAHCLHALAVGAEAATRHPVGSAAAGSITESIMKLECTIDPMVIKQKAGGGADCTFETGQ